MTYDIEAIRARKEREANPKPIIPYYEQVLANLISESLRMGTYMDQKVLKNFYNQNQDGEKKSYLGGLELELVNAEEEVPRIKELARTYLPLSFEKNQVSRIANKVDEDDSVLKLIYNPKDNSGEREIAYFNQHTGENLGILYLEKNQVFPPLNTFQ
ncbi:MAG: hypothetical protein H6500_02455 [Candidatus Woesearchaeota archaeon]|nr:MAG: hypothetical protein H6500_02455 [Candidatus Woesearchaeota archaeon]